MGYGDAIMATGIAKGARARGKRIAFGDETKILWDKRTEEIFLGNPNVAPPGSERDPDIEWVRHYKGNRLYNQQMGHKWRWRMNHRAKPGEIYFSPAEARFGEATGRGFILMEPHIPPEKSCAPNKQWPLEKWDATARTLAAEGHEVVQLWYHRCRHRLPGARLVQSPNFRMGLAALSGAKLAVLPEGGLHHGAAALGVKAVVLFGGFIPPEVTGYPQCGHINLTGGALACGSIHKCEHCVVAMNSITVDEVLDSAHSLLAMGDGRCQRTSSLNMGFNVA